jgi:hypothetical protein
MIQQNELYAKHGFKPRNLCIKPFCISDKLPDQLGLCCNCLKELEEMIGMREIYDYSGQTPKLKITTKEAIELLIQNKKGSLIGKLRFDIEPCYYCRERIINSNPQNP